MAEDLDGTWTRLVAWLEAEHSGFRCRVEWKDVPGAGRGLFTTSDLAPGETLLSIPQSAMVNPLTLPPSTIPTHLFPQPISHSHRLKRPRKSDPAIRRLNTTQLLTLHLALARDKLGRHPSRYEVYLDTLPTSFRPWHPLTWHVPPDAQAKIKKEAKEWEWWRTLARLIPRGATSYLQEVRRRYEEDLSVLREILRDEEPFKSQDFLTAITSEHLLWAWLTVNTRTVHIPLNLPAPSDLHNHTLVPLLDLINHSSSPHLVIARPRQVPLTRLASPGKIGFELLAPDRGLKAGEEVLFEYGRHSNALLLAEYGFVEREGIREVDLGWAVDELWQGVEGKDGKEEVLRGIGCWRQNIFESQTTVHPSHGLMMTLRILHLPENSDKLAAIKDGALTYISPGNEGAAMRSLRTVCQRVSEASVGGLDKLAEIGVGEDEDEDEDEQRKAAVGMVRALWEEEGGIAREVMRAVERGERFA